MSAPQRSAAEMRGQKGPLSTTVLPCPACEGREFKVCLRKKGISYERCTGCGLERRDPLPTQKELAAYYEAAYATGLYVEFVEAAAMKRATARWRLRAMGTAAISGRWLDVGCADGVFLEEAAGPGRTLRGIDLSTAAVDATRKRGISADVGTLHDTDANDRFDVITMFDVLEHTLAPRETLEAASRRLSPGGQIAISVPNLGSVSRMLMGDNWYFYIPEEHMHLFSRRSMALLLEGVGLRAISMTAASKPMTLAYSLTQFKEYNPLIYRVLAPVSRILPWLRDAIVPLPIGELMVIGAKPPHAERERA